MQSTEVHTNVLDNCPHCATHLSGGNLGSSHIQTGIMTTTGSHRVTHLHAAEHDVGPVSEPLWKTTSHRLHRWNLK